MSLLAPFEIKYRANQRPHLRGVADVMVYDFRPPPPLKGRLDGLSLHVRLVGGQVTGTLDINPQEHGLAGHLKALGGRDVVHEPITFPAASLSAPEASAEFQGVVDRLRALLQPYLAH